MGYSSDVAIGCLAGIASACLCVSAQAQVLSNRVHAGSISSVDNQQGSAAQGSALYSAECNDATDSFLCQDSPDAPEFSCRTYDEFVVPENRSWSITGFSCEGSYSTPALPP